MNLLQLAENDGLQPKKVASTNGGEYHSPCPGCGGKDRFIIWDKQDRYRCRKCQKWGDLIQYLRDFRHLSYIDACTQLGVEPQKRKTSLHLNPKFQPSIARLPSQQWRTKANQLADYFHTTLLKTPCALEIFFKRGMTLETIKHFHLGWNPQTMWLKRSHWGLPDDNKKLWFPKGLVIPALQSNAIIKLKVRRSDCHPQDERPKYVEISGSTQMPALYGNPSGKPVMILESELDAILVQQYAADLCCSMALGGSTKRPDANSHQLLTNAPSILFTCDVDQAGAIAYRWWKNTYPQLKIWVPPVGKSPGDAYSQGIDLRKWIATGLEALSI